MSGEASQILKKVLDFMQGRRSIRIALGVVLIGTLLALAARSIISLIPRHYALKMTGGDMVSNGHLFARILQKEAPKKNVTLSVYPQDDALDQVSRGELDLAFIQGGLDTDHPNVEHVATLAPDLVHLLVKPGIKSLVDLKGKSINLGAKSSAAHQIGERITQFAGLHEGIDYVATTYDAEQLLALPSRKLPDGIFVVSAAPSYLVELLVRADGYDVLEIPFPESLALRYGWAANGQILGYTYNLDPPVPAKTISTVSVNTHLVAHAGTDPAAISKLLEVVYSPAVAAKLRQPFDEKSISIPSGYPLSPGTGVYLARNDSILTLETWNKLTSSFGLLMGFGGMFIVVLKWFRGAEPTPVYDDKEFHGYMAEVVSIESMVAAMETARSINVREVRSMRARLNHLRAEVLDRYPRMRLKDANLFDHCIASVRAAHEHLGAVLAKERGRGIHSTAPPPAPEGSS